MYKVYLTEEEVQYLLNHCRFEELSYIMKIGDQEDKLNKIIETEEDRYCDSYRAQKTLIYFFKQRALLGDIIQKLLLKEEC